MNEIRRRIAALSPEVQASLSPTLERAMAESRTPDLGELRLAGLAMLADAMLAAPALGDIFSPSNRRIALFARLLEPGADSAEGDACRALTVAFLRELSTDRMGTYYEYLDRVRDLAPALAVALADGGPFAERYAAYHFCVLRGAKVTPAQSGLSTEALALAKRIEALALASKGSWGEALVGGALPERSVLREVATIHCASERTSKETARLAGLALARAEALAGEPISPQAYAAVVAALVAPYALGGALHSVVQSLDEASRANAVNEALARAGSGPVHPASAYAHHAPSTLPRLLEVADAIQLGKYQKPDDMVRALVAFGSSAAPAIAASLTERKTALGKELAVRALAEIGTDACAPALVEMLGEGKGVKLAAIAALGRLNAVEALQAGLKSKKKAVREECSKMLAAGGPAAASEAVATGEDAMAQEALLQVIKTPNTHERRAKLGALVKEGKGLEALALLPWSALDSHLTAYEELMDLLCPKHAAEAAAIAVQSLVGIAKPPPPRRIKYYVGPLSNRPRRLSVAAAPLVQALSGPDFPLRPELFELLTAVLTDADRTSAEAVLLAGLDDGSKRVRELAVVEVAKLGVGVTPRVVALLSSKRADTRQAAADVLASMPSDEAKHALEQALEAEKKAPVAAAMERALAACGGAAEPKGGDAPKGDADVLAELAKTKKAKLPPWLTPVLRPVALASGGVLEGDLLTAFVVRLMNEGPETEDALARAVRPLLDDAAAHVLSASIFAAWVAKSEAKHKWAVYQQALLASDARIQQIATQLGSFNHHLAGWCIDVLLRRGLASQAVPNAGLSWVAHWARAATTPSLQTKAREALDLIASRTGCTVNTLGPAVDPYIADAIEDAAIASFGLEGVVSYELGARVLRARVGPLTTLELVTGDGEVIPRWPSSGADDATKAAAAKQAFQDLSKRFAAAAKHESQRLERAMVSGRRYRTDAFGALMIEHPWMHKLGERLLFCTDDGTLFRISERSAIGVDYGEIAIRTPVRIAHRAELSDADAAAWHAHFDESEVVELFSQLTRPVFREPFDLTPRVPPKTLAARLLDRGFRFGRAEDAGNVYQSIKLFPGRGQRAIVEHSAINVNGNDWNTDPARITGIDFSNLYDRSERLKDADVDPVVRSEVARDVVSILAQR